MFYHPCRHWIQLYITITRKQIVFSIDQTAFMATFPQRPTATITLINVLNVSSANGLDNFDYSSVHKRAEQPDGVYTHHRVVLNNAANLSRIGYAKAQASKASSVRADFLMSPPSIRLRPSRLALYSNLSTTSIKCFGSASNVGFMLSTPILTVT